MNTPADKAQKNERQSISDGTFQMRTSGTASIRLTDNRPEAAQAVQLKTDFSNYSPKPQQLIQKKENSTGLPDNLKSGIENLSGFSMDDVKVHYNSSKPAQLHAHAYAQGTDIHLGSGQEKHLPHEAWHVVQQKQGRVKPTLQMKGNVDINDDACLEKEADIMGNKALQSSHNSGRPDKTYSKSTHSDGIAQRVAFIIEDPELTKGMQERLNIAFETINTKILSHSSLARGANNQVVIHAVSHKTQPDFESYASTLLYIGKNGYKGDAAPNLNDYNQFTGFWNWLRANGITRDVAVRVVITINLTANNTVDELYATLLHEWYVHAAKWENTIWWIRNVFGSWGVSWIQSSGHKKREDDEHIAFANWSDDEIEKKVDVLGLGSGQKKNVIKKIKRDRDSHDKKTGEFKKRKKD